MKITKELKKTIDEMLDFDKEEDALSKAEDWHNAVEEMAQLGVPGANELNKNLLIIIDAILENREELN